MSEFRPGDRYVVIDGMRRRLRLSISALAEIAHVLQAETPSELAGNLRRAGPPEWNLILNAMATPRPEIDLSEERLAQIVPILSAVISESLTT